MAIRKASTKKRSLGSQERMGPMVRHGISRNRAAGGRTKSRKQSRRY